MLRKDRLTKFLALSGTGLDTAVLGIAVLLWAIAFWPAYIANWDGSSMAEVAQALASGRLDVACTAGTVEHEGRCYSSFYPLQSVLAVPVVLLTSALPLGSHTDAVTNMLVHIVPVLAAAGSAMLVYRLAHESGASRRASMWASLTMVFCTSMLVYARSFFAESLAAFMLTLAAFGYLQAERRTWLAAIGTAGLVLTKPQLVFVALAVVVVGSWRRPPRAFLTGVGALAWATGLHLLYNAARFGDPVDFGGETRTLTANALSPERLIESLGLLLVSPGRGFLVYAPVAALGLALLAKRQATRLTAIVLAVAASLLFVALLNPGGGVNWGSRYLLPLVPLAAVGLAFLPRGLYGPAAVAAAWGLLVSLPTLLVPFESAYREPVAHGRLPATIYWSIGDGPIVQLWAQIPEVLNERSAWLTWWREFAPPWTVVAVMVSLCVLVMAAWVVVRAWKLAGAAPAHPRDATRGNGVARGGLDRDTAARERSG